MARNPFAFLDSESKDRTLLLLLLALIHKQGDAITLDLQDLTDIDDGCSFYKSLDDTGTKLVLRFARRGAEAYFLPPMEDSSPARASSRSSRPTLREQEPLKESTSRHAIHDDMDLAMREEEMATRSEAARKRSLMEARREAGAMPWTTRQ